MRTPRSADGRDPIGNAYGEVIPSIPWGPSDQPFMGRDVVVRQSEHLHTPGDPKILFDPRRHFSKASGELWLHCYCNVPTASQLNGVLGEAREMYGKDEVKAIVLTVCQETFREYFAFFTCRGFERREAKERGPWFVLSGPARQWR